MHLHLLPFPLVSLLLLAKLFTCCNTLFLLKTWENLSESWVLVNLVTGAKCLDNSCSCFPSCWGEETCFWFSVGDMFHPQDVQDNCMWWCCVDFLIFFFFPEHLPVLSSFWCWQLFSGISFDEPAVFCLMVKDNYLVFRGEHGAFQFPQALGLHSSGSLLKAKFLTWCLLLCLSVPQPTFFLFKDGSSWIVGMSMEGTKWYEAFAQHRVMLASWLVFVLLHSGFFVFFFYWLAVIRSN